MINYFIFDGVDSREYNVHVASSNMFDSPAENVETVEIPYRNEPLHISTGTFKPFELKVVCYMPDGLRNNVDAFRNFLQSRFKACRYSEALKPDEYRIARFKSAFELTSSDTERATFLLTFETGVQRYLTDNAVINVPSGQSVINAEYFSEPKLNVLSNGTININGNEIVVTDAPVIIDSQKKQCYVGTTNKNNGVQLDEFPSLIIGENTIDTTVSFTLTPNWWRI